MSDLTIRGPRFRHGAGGLMLVGIGLVAGLLAIAWIGSGSRPATMPSDDVTAAGPRADASVPAPTAGASAPTARLTGDEAAAIVLQQLARMDEHAVTFELPRATAEIESVAMTTLGQVSALEPRAARMDPGAPGSDQPVRVVRAVGTFVGLRVPPGREPVTGNTGYFVIDGVTGGVLAMGTP